MSADSPPKKGVEVAVDALHRLKGSANGDGRSWQLSLAGAGNSNHVSKLKKKVAKLGLSNQVHFLGYIPQDDLPSLYRDHGILLVPSLWEEPFGRVVIEGMASSCLVLASHRGALPEIVRHGESGILFSPGDAQELASWLGHAAKNPEWASSITSYAHQYALREFNFEKMMTKVENLLWKVASPDPDRRVNPARVLPLAQQTKA